MSGLSIFGTDAVRCPEDPSPFLGAAPICGSATPERTACPAGLSKAQFPGRAGTAPEAGGASSAPSRRAASHLPSLPVGSHTHCAHCGHELTDEQIIHARKFCNGTCAHEAASAIAPRSRERWGIEEDEDDDR